jgi:hypothetical protein
MRQDKLAAIRRLIEAAFPTVNIEERHDFDLDAERFRIDASGEILLLKVSGVYLDDNAIANIEADFHRWRVLEELRRQRALLVTSAGSQALEVR